MARTHGAQPGTEGDPQARQRAPLEQGQGLEEEGGTPSHQRAQTACRQEGWGQTSIRPRASSARSLRAEKGGDPPKWPRVHIEHGMPARERGEPPNQEEEEGAPPKQRALPSHGMQERGGVGKHGGHRQGTPQEACNPSARHSGMGRGRDPRPGRRRGGNPPKQSALPAHGMQERGRWGFNPRSGAHALHAWSDTGDGGQTPRPADASHRQTKRCGGGRRRGKGNN